jgi:hypothetical protein
MYSIISSVGLPEHLNECAKFSGLRSQPRSKMESQICQQRRVKSKVTSSGSRELLHVASQERKVKQRRGLESREQSVKPEATVSYSV